MSASPPLSRVVVVGRDVGLWLAVTALNSALGQAGVQVVAVEMPTRLKTSHISATLPPLEAFHTKLGLTEQSLIRATAGSFSFGENVVDLCGKVPNFFHAWGAYGAPIEGSAFFPCWLKARRLGFNRSFQHFCLTAIASQNGRMLLPDEATATFGRTDYGYHLQTMAYAVYLKSTAVAQGVLLYEAQDVGVERADSGSIAAVTIDGSVRLEGELFVDASGEDAILMGRRSSGASEDWRAHFNVDRVLLARAPAFTSIPPFAEVRTARTGWTALHPSQVATGVIHAFSSSLLSDDMALQSASAACGVKLADASFHSVNPGVRSQVWDGNCVAVGGSACVFDPIFDIELHALQLGLVHLLALFPASAQFAPERAEYNRIMRSYYERIRDFQCAFYALSPLEGEFWQKARELVVPPALAHKIATFRARGEIAPMEDETFSPESWQVIFTGLGLVPDSWPPSIDKIASNRVDQEFRRILEFIQKKVIEQPTHDNYLESLCRQA
ncbi:MAG TPA: tryptophan 7-halogenase [Steroidobacteraceae bacterium]